MLKKLLCSLVAVCNTLQMALSHHLCSDVFSVLSLLSATDSFTCDSAAAAFALIVSKINYIEVVGN